LQQDYWPVHFAGEDRGAILRVREVEQLANAQKGEGSRGVGTPVLIDETPLRFWEVEGSDTQLQFLESIDPDYFVYLGRIHESQLDGNDSRHAAVGLRISYSHALETLFALIGAAVQAPDCPAGWMLKYKITELNGLLAKITDQKPFHNRLGLVRSGWTDVAIALSPNDESSDELEEHRSATAKLWRALAKQLLDEDFDQEYNSLKHGFRVSSGEWYFALGHEDTPGVAALPERMHLMAQSPFGSSFFRPVWLKKHQWMFEDQRVNWSPTVFARRLPFIAATTANVLAFLKVANGAQSENLGVILLTHDAVEKALSDPDHSTGTKLSWRMGNKPKMIPDITAEDILTKYVQTSPPRDADQEGVGGDGAV
jgi:hypothetical protein